MKGKGTRVPIDISGQVFGRLTVVQLSKYGQGQKPRWYCVCSCGGNTTTSGSNLRNGHTTSCGCLNKERTGDASRRHGKTGTKLWRAWRAMWSRCTNSNLPCYKNYGGRGISVDDRWKDFEAFASDMGEPPSSEHSIDRIDVNGNYCRDNCRWATVGEQAVNRRNNHVITVDGLSKTVSEWARELEVSPYSIFSRIHLYGYSDVEAVTKPFRRRKKND